MRIMTLALLNILSLAAAAALAGPLDPPAGSPQPTMKTLDEAEPRTPLSQDNTPGDANSVFRIDSSGSYYLTEDLIVPANHHGVEIAVNEVQLDLSGFTIDGQTDSLDGVHLDGTRALINISNGVLHDLDGDGIGGPLNDSVIENVTVSGCGDFGVDVRRRVVVRDVLASFCGAGVRVGSHSVVERAVASLSQTGVGIDADSASRIVDCNANFSLAGDGFVLANDCVITGSVARFNSGDGIVAGESSRVEDSVSVHNGGNGITLGFAGVASDCTMESNGFNGAEAGVAASVLRCDVHRNDGHGIFLESRARAVGNHVTESGVNVAGGLSGVIVFSDRTDCVIKDNTLVENDFNMNVNGTGCTVVRNISTSGVSGGISIGAGNFGDVVGDPSIAGPWDNIDN